MLQIAGCPAAGALMFYNTMVALPMSLSLVKDRLEQGYYRQVQGLLGDVAAIQRNATDFNGGDSQVAELAAGQSRCQLPLCFACNQQALELAAQCDLFHWRGQPSC